MLHWIRLPDPQPHQHDHPVGFLSLTIRGGYEEETPTGVNGRRLRFKRATDRHRILRVLPGTITLVFAGPVTRDWGHWVDEQWIPWREYQQEFNELPGR
jgi:hypothetical protein